MADRTDARNPWLIGAVIVAVWVVIWAGIQTLLFDGQPLAAAVQGAAGGAAFAVVYLYLNRQGTD